jgi:hypothetical protein
MPLGQNILKKLNNFVEIDECNIQLYEIAFKLANLNLST